MELVIPGPVGYSEALAEILKQFTPLMRQNPEQFGGGQLEMTHHYGDELIIVQATHISSAEEKLNAGSPLLTFQSSVPATRAHAIADVFTSFGIAAGVVPGITQAKGKMFIVEVPDFPHLRFLCRLPDEEMPKPDQPKKESRKPTAKIRASRRRATKKK